MADRYDNMPIDGVSHNPVEGNSDRMDTGNALKDGYTVRSRRPKTSWSRERTDPETADSMEGRTGNGDMPRPSRKRY